MAQVQSVQQVDPTIPGILEDFYVAPEGEAPGIIQKGQELFSKGFEDVYGPGAQSLMGLGGIAPMSQSQQELGRQIAGLQAPGAFTTAEEAQEAGIQRLLAAPGKFGTAQAEEYMSPYLQGVVDVQQRKAIDAAKKAQLDANLAAARQGTYGGARQALLTGARESGLRTQLGDIQARGLQAAFENAQAQFERDRAAQMAAAQGLGGLGAQLGGLGVQQQAAELDRLKTLGAYGDLERALTQEGLSAEAAYQRERDEFGQQQLGRFSNLLRGIPMTGQTTTATTPPPSFAAQLSGLGITGLSLAKLLGG
tara:strand:+ start:102 stop:1025 length:924 start_codon:yes stop_codon:yes gene_type:complete